MRMRSRARRARAQRFLWRKGKISQSMSSSTTNCPVLLRQADLLFVAVLDTWSQSGQLSQSLTALRPHARCWRRTDFLFGGLADQWENM